MIRIYHRKVFRKHQLSRKFKSEKLKQTSGRLGIGKVKDK